MYPIYVSVFISTLLTVELYLQLNWTIPSNKNYVATEIFGWDASAKKKNRIEDTATK